jgi:hypothetical protein
MLRGLPGIQHKSVQLAYTVLLNISTSDMHSRVLPSLGWIYQIPSRPSRGASSVPR